MRWSDREKLAELQMDGMRHLQLRYSATDALAAFASFQATKDESPEGMVPIVYLYELQVAQVFQGHGLGSWLLEWILTDAPPVCRKDLGRPCQKVVLTCHTANSRALEFYRKHGFNTDWTCPSNWTSSRQELERLGYTILSKDIVVVDQKETAKAIGC